MVPVSRWRAEHNYRLVCCYRKWGSERSFSRRKWGRSKHGAETGSVSRATGSAAGSGRIQKPSAAACAVSSFCEFLRNFQRNTSGIVPHQRPHHGK